MTTTKLQLPELAASQSQPEVPVNLANRRLEAAVQLSVLDKDLTAPPVSPPAGAYYIVGSPATGAWAGHETEVAFLVNSTWTFLLPIDGWLAWVQDEQVHYKFDGLTDEQWEEFEAGSPGGSGSITVGDATGSPTFEVASVTRLMFASATVTDQGDGQALVTPTASAANGNGTLTTTTSSSGTLTIDHSAGGDFTTTLGENVTTVTHSNVTNGAANWFTLRIVQDGTGGRTFAPPASWKYPSGVSAYTVSSGAGDIDLVQGVSYDNGTSWMISYEKDFT